MTVEELAMSDRVWVTPEDIAEILGSNQATIRETVRQDPQALAVLWPIRTGNRVKFSRMRVLNWIRGTEEKENAPHAAT